MKVILLSILLFFILVNSTQPLAKDKINKASLITKIVENIKSKNIEILKSLLSKNNANSVDDKNITLLSRAVLANDIVIVKLLLEKGANPNLPNNTKSKSTPLMMASNVNSVEIARYLLENGAEINTQNSSGDSAINWSAYSGQVELTKLFLDFGANTKQKSLHTDNTMQVALREYQDKIVELLIQYNQGTTKINKDAKRLVTATKENDLNYLKQHITQKNVDTTDEAGNSLLQIAASLDNLPLIKLLLQNNASINKLNDVGFSALNLAISQHKNTSAEFLIAMSADTNKTDTQFKITPLLTAAKTNNLSIAPLLIENQADVNATDKINGFSALFYTAFNNNLDFLKLLLKNHADINHISHYKTTVFDSTTNNKILTTLNKYKQNEQYASQIIKIVDLIQSKNIKKLKQTLTQDNVNLFDKANVSLLSRAVLSNNTELVKLFINKKANTNITNQTKLKSTALMMAVNVNNLEIANLLLKNGANINIQDANGDAAINWSTYMGQYEMTKLFLENQAITTLKSIHAENTMGIALKEWNDEIVELLIEHKQGIFPVSTKEQVLIQAVKSNDFPRAKQLINTANINTKDAAGNSLLIIAASKGHEKIVKLLLKSSAQIDYMNPVGHTALNKSIWNKNNGIAKYLISQSADINKMNLRFKLPPLVAAVRSKNYEMGRILLEKGAHINTTDAINNFTPLVWAVLNNDQAFVKLLMGYHPDLFIVSKYKTSVFTYLKDTDLKNLVTFNPKTQQVN